MIPRIGRFRHQGHLLIDKEILSYTGISSGAFTGVSRGLIGTTIADHANNTEIVYLDAVVDPRRLKGDVTGTYDVNRIYNIIRSSDGSVAPRDTDSIDVYKELPYTLNLANLTQHENAWRAAVFDEYLEDLKDLRQLLNFSVQPGKETWGLQLGDVIGFRYDVLIYAGRIVSITYGNEAIQLQVRTIV